MFFLYFFYIYKVRTQLHKQFNWMWIWWLPWYPQRRRVLQALLEEVDEQRSGSHGKKEWPSCCIWQAWMLQGQGARRYRWWRSSRWTFLSWRYQCLGEPALTPCRCMSHMTQFSWFFSWRRPSLGSLQPSFLRMVSLPFLMLLVCFSMFVLYCLLRLIYITNNII